MIDYSEVTAQNRVRRMARSFCRELIAAIRARRAKDPADDCTDLKDYVPKPEVEYFHRMLTQRRRDVETCFHLVAGEDGRPPRCQQFERACYEHLDVAACRFYRAE